MNAKRESIAFKILLSNEENKNDNLNKLRVNKIISLRNSNTFVLFKAFENSKTSNSFN